MSPFIKRVLAICKSFLWKLNVSGWYLANDSYWEAVEMQKEAPAAANKQEKKSTISGVIFEVILIW